MNREIGHRERRSQGEDGWRFEPAGKTFALDEEPRTPSLDRTFDQDEVSLDPHTDDDKTPARPEIVARLAAVDNERRDTLALDIAEFLKKVPETLSIPAYSDLAKLPKEEIQQYEETYRRLDGDLKALLEKHIPSLHLPSFDQLMEEGPSSGNLVKSLRPSFRQEASYLLSARLFPRVANLLSLFAAFAANIGNARYIQEHMREDMQDSL